MKMKCSSCGGDLITSEQTCKYCGAPNPSYVAPSVQPAGYKSTAAPTYTPPTQSYSSTPATKKSINWFVFFLLLIIFWPGAIAYLIIRSK